LTLPPLALTIHWDGSLRPNGYVLLSVRPLSYNVRNLCEELEGFLDCRFSDLVKT
jgi:hypothetical protein